MKAVRGTFRLRPMNSRWAPFPPLPWCTPTARLEIWPRSSSFCDRTGPSTHR